MSIRDVLEREQKRIIARSERIRKRWDEGLTPKQLKIVQEAGFSYGSRLTGEASPEAIALSAAFTEVAKKHGQKIKRGKGYAPDMLTGDRNVERCLLDGGELELDVFGFQRLSDYISKREDFDLRTEKFGWECEECDMVYLMPLSEKERNYYERERRNYKPLLIANPLVFGTQLA